MWGTRRLDPTLNRPMELERPCRPPNATHTPDPTPVPAPPGSRPLTPDGVESSAHRPARWERRGEVACPSGTGLQERECPESPSARPESARKSAKDVCHLPRSATKGVGGGAAGLDTWNRPAVDSGGALESQPPRGSPTTQKQRKAVRQMGQVTVGQPAASASRCTRAVQVGQGSEFRKRYSADLSSSSDLASRRGIPGVTASGARPREVHPGSGGLEGGSPKPKWATEARS